MARGKVGFCSQLPKSAIDMSVADCRELFKQITGGGESDDAQCAAMVRATLTATEDDHESNLPTGHASRGPATTVGIVQCLWATEMPERARPGTVLQGQWTRLVACAVDWVVWGKGKVGFVLQANALLLWSRGFL